MYRFSVIDGLLSPLVLPRRNKLSLRNLRTID